MKCESGMYGRVTMFCESARSGLKEIETVLYDFLYDFLKKFQVRQKVSDVVIFGVIYLLN